MTPSIYFVILTYEPDMDLLRMNLKFLFNQNVIIVDNSADEDAAKELVGISKKSFHLIINKSNLGYTGGMNAGMKYGFDQGAEWVVLLNDDVELYGYVINNLQNILLSHNPSIVGPYPGFLDSGRWTTILKPQAPFSTETKRETHPDYISGSFFSIHKNVYREIHGFFDKYFMYYEDVDFCISARKLGFPIVSIPLSDIEHKESSKSENLSNLHQYYLARNHLLFVERHAPITVKIHEFVRLPKTLWEHFSKKEWGALEGIRDYFLRRFGQLSIGLL